MAYAIGAYNQNQVSPYVAPVDANALASYGGNDAATSGLFSDMSGMDMAKLGIAGVGTVGNLWSAWQANKLGKEQLALATDAYNTNLNNSISQYNTSLEDRIRARASVTGMSDSEVNDYIAKNSLSR